ncbi:hypothetical protein HG535_0G00890 [Zygotorulaspora mrakii]|uniref:AD domain-containing protein n=1 Tax=Zygotorulaspora mrakii TaxID=42260 RepID=A0A7H9B654_ZYGMR|nr:uncharacterized protein HG535_0G00890 [Zygotorulaspora mrakii]QLG74205.1 hypothetical protein HG535_0G00890 [Zygotorulaspora mrakii]
MSTNLESVLGFKVRVTNVLDQITEGKIYSFNSANNTLTLLTTKKGQPQSFKVIKCSFIKNLEVLGDKPASNTFKRQHIRPQHVNVERIEQLLRQKLAEQKTRSIRTGKNVSKEGQFLFDMLYKTVSDTKWVDKKIVVLDDVEISPPYKLENVKPLHGSHTETETLVKRILQRGQEKLNDMMEMDGRRGG